MKKAAIGDRVTIRMPETRADGTVGEVIEVCSWGVVLRAPASAFGTVRAGWSEFEQTLETTESRSLGYTGDICNQCGGSKMTRNGACLLCQDCGASSGCS
jgi:hypothetical protein